VGGFGPIFHRLEIRSNGKPEASLISFAPIALERPGRARLGVKTLFIERGSPWKNGYTKLSNRKLRDERLNQEVSTTLAEARLLTEDGWKRYNQVRPHSALNYLPPAPEAIIPVTLT